LSSLGGLSVRRFPFVLLLGFACLFVPALAQAAEDDHWSDISDTTWLTDYSIEAAEVAGLADGYPDGTFRPYDSVTRGQFVKMGVNGLGVKPVTPLSATFPDVLPSHIFFRYVEGAVASGLVGGFADGTFRAESVITRQQANSILGRHLSNEELEMSGVISGKMRRYPNLQAWYEAEGSFYLGAFTDIGQLAAAHAPATAYLVYHEVVKGNDLQLRPLSELTRAQAAALVLRVRERVRQMQTTPPTPRDVRTFPAGPASDPTPLLSGWVRPGETVKIYETTVGRTGLLLGAFAASDGSFSVQLTAMSEGLHSFAATAVSPLGVESSLSEGVQYLLDQTPPTVTISAPASGARVNSRTFPFTATAGDAGAGVGSVTFSYREEGESAFRAISTDFEAPYEAVWADISLPDGRYELMAEVQDRAGNRAQKTGVFVVLDSAGPALEVVTPRVSGLLYTSDPTPEFVVAPDPNATGAPAPTLVEFRLASRTALPADSAEWIAGQFSLVSEDAAAPFAIDWGEGSLSDGEYVLAARARDATGNWSRLVWVRVIVDSVGPSVSLDYPQGIVPDLTPMILAWTVSDASPVSLVSLELQDSEQGSWQTLGTGLQEQGQLSWVTPDYPGRTRLRFRLTAVDAAGNQAVVTSDWSMLQEAPSPSTGLQVIGPSEPVETLDGSDFTLAWAPSASVDIVAQRVFVLPAGVGLDPNAHSAVDILDTSVEAWSGDEFLVADSAGTPLDPVTDYVFWIVSVDIAGQTARSQPAIWTSPGPAVSSASFSR